MRSMTLDELIFATTGGCKSRYGRSSMTLDELTTRVVTPTSDGSVGIDWGAPDEAPPGSELEELEELEDGETLTKLLAHLYTALIRRLSLR